MNLSPQEIIESGLLELYAIDALSGEELSLVETAIAEHQDVADEYDLVQATIIAYAQSEAIVPPARNRDRFFEAVEKDSNQIARFTATLPTTPFESNPEAQTTSQLPTTPFESNHLGQPTSALPTTPREEPMMRRVEQSEDEDAERQTLSLYPPDMNAQATGKPMMFALVASLLLFAVSSLFALQYYNKWKSTEGQLVALQEERGSLLARTARYSTDSSALAILASSTTKSGLLTSEAAAGMIKIENAPASRVKIAWSKENATALVRVENLPAPPEGMQYQLWALVGGKPVDAGMLPLKGDKGSESAFIEMKDIPQAELFAITLEKSGGVPSPTLEQMFVAGAVN